MRRAILSKKLDNNLVECLACSWHCRISPSQVGVCGTRLNNDGVLYLLVWGKTTGLAVDPVEKKPLYHFLPGSRLLSFGTVGCNFGCLFCQNAWMSQATKIKDIRSKTNNYPKKLLAIIDKLSISTTPRQIVDEALRYKVAGIAYTYNEPAIFAEFTLDTAKTARRYGLKNVYVSNGFESEQCFNLLKDYLDAVNIDLKSFSSDFYLKICKGKIEPVLENIKRFFSYGIETEVTTLVISGYNDSRKELTAIAQFLVSISHDIPWHLSAFYPAYKMLDIPPTSHQKLIEAYDIGKKAGLRYVYLGNVKDNQRESTYCPKCLKILIRRDCYNVEIENLDLEKGRCKNCREKIYGIWR